MGRQTDGAAQEVSLGPSFEPGPRLLSHLLLLQPAQRWHHRKTPPTPPTAARVAKSVAWHRWQWQSRPDASNQILFYFAPSFRISNFDCQRVCVAVLFYFISFFFCPAFFCFSLPPSWLLFQLCRWRNAKYLRSQQAAATITVCNASNVRLK